MQAIKAGVETDVLADDQVRKIKGALSSIDIAQCVQIRFKGQDQDMQETMVFLVGAFITAIFLMVIILVTQFNSYYQAALVLSAIAGGLTFATALTLFLTHLLLMLGDNVNNWLVARKIKEPCM